MSSWTEQSEWVSEWTRKGEIVKERLGEREKNEIFSLARTHVRSIASACGGHFVLARSRPDVSDGPGKILAIDFAPVSTCHASFVEWKRDRNDRVARNDPRQRCRRHRKPRWSCCFSLRETRGYPAVQDNSFHAGIPFRGSLSRPRYSRARKYTRRERAWEISSNIHFKSISNYVHTLELILVDGSPFENFIYMAFERKILFILFQKEIPYYIVNTIRSTTIVLVISE